MPRSITVGDVSCFKKEKRLNFADSFIISTGCLMVINITVRMHKRNLLIKPTSNAFIVAITIIGAK